VIAPLVVGLFLVVAVWFLLFRPSPPSSTFEPVGPASSFVEGRARAVGLPGVFVGRTGGDLYAVLQDDGCTVTVCGLRYVDCRGAAYGLDGQAAGGGSAGLDLLPLRVYRGTVYVDPGHPVRRSPAPASTTGPPDGCG
jgi:hypothetical protein